MIDCRTAEGSRQNWRPSSMIHVIYMFRYTMFCMYLSMFCYTLLCKFKKKYKSDLSAHAPVNSTRGGFCENIISSKDFDGLTWPLNIYIYIYEEESENMMA